MATANSICDDYNETINDLEKCSMCNIYEKVKEMLADEYQLQNKISNLELRLKQNETEIKHLQNQIIDLRSHQLDNAMASHWEVENMVSQSLIQNNQVSKLIISFFVIQRIFFGSKS